MKVKQVSVFLENKSGRIAEVTRLLGDSSINLKAVSIADTADFGILRFIPDKPEDAVSTLERAGYIAKLTSVIAVEIEDHPGSLADVLAIFEKRAINIEYLYASLERGTKNAVIIFKVEDAEQAIGVLSEEHVRILSNEEMIGL
jgi:hypothetical protein